MNTVDLLDRTQTLITALRELVAERPDLPTVVSIAVREYDDDATTVQITSRASAAGLLAWCRAVGARSGRRPQSSLTVTAWGVLAGVPVQVLGSLRTAGELGEEWPVSRLAELAAEGGEAS
ncbi:MAG: hypothetical protein GEU94_11310 [Micromonosporaceae bacterium]|nr:hypothetical protein [Micromonosporaceae bacterium]